MASHLPAGHPGHSACCNARLEKASFVVREGDWQRCKTCETPKGFVELLKQVWGRPR